MPVPQNTSRLLGSYETAGLNGGRYDGLQQDHLFTRRTQVMSAEVAELTIREAMKNAEAATTRYMAGGSTATMAIITHDNRLVVGQVGDSPILIYSRNPANGQVTVNNLTYNHSPLNVSERARVLRDGGMIDGKRVTNGEVGIAVSRAFGDHAVTGISKTPQVTTHDLNHYLQGKNQVWVVVGSDGMTENGKPPAIGQAALVTAPKHPADLAKILAEQAMARGSTDNIAVTATEVTKGPHKQSVVIAVMDGHGEGGESASKAVGRAFAQTLDRRGFTHIPVNTPAPASPTQTTSRDSGPESRPAAANPVYIDSKGYGWVEYDSRQYGDSHRYSRPFTSVDATFTQEMKDRHNVKITWGERDGKYYAYVPRSDSPSTTALHQYFENNPVTAAGAAVRPSGSPSLVSGLVSTLRGLADRIEKFTGKVALPLDIGSRAVNAAANNAEGGRLVEAVIQEFKLNLSPEAQSEFVVAYAFAKGEQRAGGNGQQGFNQFIEWGQKYSIPLDAMVRLNPTSASREVIDRSMAMSNKGLLAMNEAQEQAQQVARPKGIAVMENEEAAAQKVPYVHVAEVGNSGRTA